MPNKCTVILETHLGKDVAMTHSQSGVAMAKLSLPYGYGKWDSESRRWAETLWMTGIAFKDLAVQVDGWKKGTAVKVTGRLQLGRPWMDREGKERRDLEIVADSVQLCLAGKVYAPERGVREPVGGDPGDDIPF